MRTLVLIAVSISFFFTSCTKETFLLPQTTIQTLPIAFETANNTASSDNVNAETTIRLQVIETSVEKDADILVLHFERDDNMKGIDFAAQQELLFVDMEGELVRHTFSLVNINLSTDYLSLQFDLSAQALSDLQLFAVQIMDLDDADEKSVITEDITLI